MKMITKQAGFALKYERQKKLSDYSDKYELHCGGACAHYGKIPKGCAGCLFTGIYGYASFVGYTFDLPNVCNANCKHCFTLLGDGREKRSCKQHLELPTNWEINIDQEIQSGSINPITAIIHATQSKNKLAIVSFSGEGSEPLLYLPVIEKVVKHFKENIEPYIDKDVTYKLYTNGKLLNQKVIDKLVDWGINEVRINSSAFKFSDEIINNMRLACKSFPVVTSELGLFPQYYNDIYRLMKDWDDMGLSHLSLCQPKYKYMEVLEKTVDMFPDDAVCYPASNDWIMVDDGGEAEKMIKYAIDNSFSFSIIDCNCMVMNQEDPNGNLAKQLNDLDFEKVIDL